MPGQTLRPVLDPGSIAGLIVVVGGITFLSTWLTHSVLNLATRRRRNRATERRIQAMKAEIVESAIAASTDWNAPAAWTSTTGPVEPPVVRRVHRTKAGAR